LCRRWWLTDEMAKPNGTILVTGGAGYVGSHTVVELLNNNYSVIAIDNLVNCFAEKNQKPESLKRVETITNQKITFYDVDIRNKDALDKVFRDVGKFGMKQS
jgi:UDP-glucose 4-epimerase